MIKENNQNNFKYRMYKRLEEQTRVPPEVQSTKLSAKV